MDREESRLEALPPEIRLQIYEPFLPKIARTTRSWRFKDRLRTEKLAIMRVCRKTYYEFKDAFWRNLELRITVTGRRMTGSGHIRPGIVLVHAGGILLQHQTNDPDPHLADQYTTLLTHVFQNLHIKNVMLRIDVSSDVDYRQLHDMNSPFSWTMKPEEYEEFALKDIKRRIAGLASMLRTASRIQNLNIGVLSCSLLPAQVFERFLDLLSLFKDIQSVEKAQIMPFWPLYFFDDRADDWKRLKETKEAVGDPSEIEGFMIMEKFVPMSTRERKWIVSRGLIVSPVNGGKYWRYPYVWKLAGEGTG